jgi:DNA-binding beta-propeller fold protein YncE
LGLTCRRRPGGRRGGVGEAIGSAQAARSRSTAAGPGGAAIADAGDVLLVGTSNGVLAIDTAALKVQRRELAGWAVDGLVASADGRRAYALSSARGQVVAIDPVSGRLLDQRAAPAASVLLHAAG